MAQPVPILMYHGIAQGDADRWTVPTSVFAEHMKWLAERNYRPVPVSLLMAARNGSLPLPPRTLAITFDDGLRNFATDALPILQQYNFPATIYIVTGYIGKTASWSRPKRAGPPMLSQREIRAIAEHGIECGAHTHSHPQLDIISPMAARTEIRRSKADLEDCLGHRVESFAYPHGYASLRVREIVHQEGFTSACRVRHALSSSREDPFALSRIIMTSGIGVADLGRLLTGDGLPVAPPVDRMLATGWRWARKAQAKLQAWSQQSATAFDCKERAPENRSQGGSRS